MLKKNRVHIKFNKRKKIINNKKEYHVFQKIVYLVLMISELS
jgi:hypothetical protein